MKNKIAITGLISFCCVWVVAAQQKIELQSPKQQHTDVRLYDEDDNFLLTLPLTFNITDENVLIMMVGNDRKLADEQSVWMFSEEMDLAGLMKSNRNVSATKPFKKQNMELNTILAPNRKIKIYRGFDEGYEIIKKNAKPVFFNINDFSSNSLTFYLQFYVVKSDNKYPYVFAAKCKPIEVELINK